MIKSYNKLTQELTKLISGVNHNESDRQNNNILKYSNKRIKKCIIKFCIIAISKK